MGEYTHETRSTGLPTINRGYEAKSNERYEATSPRKFEYVYSYRSRPRKGSLDDLASESNFGIPLPNRDKGLITSLRSRKEFTERISQEFAGASSKGSTPSAGSRISRTDTGHHFVKCTYNAIRTPRVHHVRYQSLGSGIRTDIRGNYFNMYDVPTLSWMNIPKVMPTSILRPIPGTAPGELELNDRVNRIFKSMNPVAEQAQLGETIVSLIRGEWPRLFKNIKEFADAISASRGILSQASGLGKYAGNEYLNASFSWKPLVDDMLSAFNVLSKIDHLVFGTGYRRKRYIPFDTYTSATSNNALLFASNAYGKGQSLGVSFNREFKPTTETIIKFDSRISARLVPIARPCKGSNYYAEKAADLAQELGLWYPQLGWDLLPYSFLIDWFSHLGSAISNAYFFGSKGSVNIDYAWMTSRLHYMKTTTFKSSRVDVIGSNPGFTEVSGYAQTLCTTTVRAPASPFGFGLDLSRLTSGQFEILTALGLARLK